MRARSLFLLAILAALPLPAYAQAPAEPPPRLESTAQVTFLANTGNSQTESLGVGGDFTYRPMPWVYTGKTLFVQNEDEDVLTARSFVGLFRASRNVTERLSLYGQYDYLRDLFAGIEHRNTVEAGVSYLVINSGSHLLRADAALGYLNEQRFTSDDFDSMIGVLGAGYRWKISETSEFSEELRALLTLADFDAWKLDNVASLTVSITSLFSLRVANTIRFSNEPVPGFEQTDTMTSVALVMKFARME